ncbi:hypothetical protein KI688_008522 [Linnemannia hyalina]|uniref:FAD-binding domain-containing protein n=1 Tax=Linnemannia hyalina TaxID=64524 RepID=A0A9P7Y3S6_9FUNG|nr:hypothetical protein KI688_008522 [Linnemannia hyalina]
MKMPTSPKTRVLVVGGGLGGLVLAILLQRAGIDYLVLEQSVLIRPIGSVIALSPLVLPLLEQLGLLDEIKLLSKPLGKITILRDDLSIPKERIHLGKRFVNSQNIIDPATRICHQVQVRCSDGSLYLADVLVGADGASSAVRQSLFRQVKEEHGSGIGSHGHGQKPLPKQDQEEQRYKQVALVGVTSPLNLKRYPDLGEAFSQFKVILNRHSPYMESEWGPDATDEMSKAVRHLKGPDEGGQGTVGDLIDATDRQLISKVMLEERIFKTWYGGRTVLLGDGALVSGKSSPAAPATPYIPSSNRHRTDSVHTSSLSSTAITWTVEDLHRKVFKPYYQARLPVVREVVDSSSTLGALLVKDGWLAEVKRKLVFTIQDSWMGRSFVDRAYAHRIQATFLKLAPDRGSVPPSQSKIVVALKKGDGGGGGIEEEEEDRYQDMDSPEGRRRLDMQLLQLQQVQQMKQQQQQQQPHLHHHQEDQQGEQEESNQRHRAIRNRHSDSTHHQYSTTQDKGHAQVDEFMTGQSSAIFL